MLKLPYRVVSSSLVVVALWTVNSGSAFASPERDRRAQERAAKCSSDPRVVLGLVSHAVCVGADLFFHETFDGNGRTCGTCHRAENNYTIDAKFIAGLGDHDPLFVAEYDPVLAELEVPELLRKYGLFVVNADGFEAPTEKFVVRSAQHMLGLATSTQIPPPHPMSSRHAEDGTLVPPLERLGWSGDGAPGEGRLRDFADGAITQHMPKRIDRVPGVDFSLPTDPERDAIAEFSRTIGRMQDFSLSQARLRDVAAERGRNVFLTGNGRECSMSCHFEGNANSAAFDDLGNLLGMIGNHTLDIGTALVRVPEVDALGIPLDGGHGTGPLDLDFDGVDDSFGNGGMNSTSLIEAADTAPMFHTHAFATLEDAIHFYASDDFANSFVGQTFEFPNRGLGEPMPLTKQDEKDLGRMLRVLNAALNSQMAAARTEASLRVHEAYFPAEREVRHGLVKLAIAEVDDALEVLSAVSHLNLAAQRLLREARNQLSSHLQCDSRRELKAALRSLDAARSSLGTGLDMPIGPGTLMF